MSNFRFLIKMATASEGRWAPWSSRCRASTDLWHHVCWACTVAGGDGGTGARRGPATAAAARSADHRRAYKPWLARPSMWTSCFPPGQSEGASFGVLAAAFCLTLLFLYFWTQAKNDYNDFDWWVGAEWHPHCLRLVGKLRRCVRLLRFNYGILGFWWAWSLVLLVIAALFFSYVAGLMVRDADTLHRFRWARPRWTFWGGCRFCLTNSNPSLKN